MQRDSRTASTRSKAIITGANSGIGKAIAMRLAADGASVLLVARNTESLKNVAADIQSSGGQADFCAVDLTERGAAEEVVQAGMSKLGGIDILVNCASLTHNEYFFDLTDDHWLAAFEVKVFGAVRLCRAAWPALKQSRGSIVNICGIGARTPLAQTSLTGASSAALMAITKSLAQCGVADRVQVNAINPGLIRTPRSELTIARMYGGGDPQEALEQSSRRAGAVRLGQPDDVASLVAYIVSLEGELLHGSIIDLDGGATKGL